MVRLTDESDGDSVDICMGLCETADETAAKYQAQLELQQRGQAKLEAVRKLMR